MAKKNKKQKPDPVPALTTERIMELLARGAKSANELDKTLKRVFTLTPRQRHMRLD